MRIFNRKSNCLTYNHSRNIQFYRIAKAPILGFDQLFVNVTDIYNRFKGISDYWQRDWSRDSVFRSLSPTVNTVRIVSFIFIRSLSLLTLSASEPVSEQ